MRDQNDGEEVPHTMPKHIPFPDFTRNSEIVNELIMFLFITTTFAMQFINIYRTVWWLPDSYMHHIVNLYLIEPWLVTLIVVLNVRRLLYCFLLRLFELCQCKKRAVYRKALRYTYGGMMLAILGICVKELYIRNTSLSLFLLVYPIIVYLLIFGFQIEPFLRSTCEIDGAYFNGMPLHSCSSTPSVIRDEIEILKNDFNNRFKQVIFTSAINAYYSGFVPCFFAASIHYNVLWVTQHIVFVLVSTMTLGTAFIFPSKYFDILHRASLHLGAWARLELRPASSNLVGSTSSVWNKNNIWAGGTVVKYSGDLYRATGRVTAAMPANSSHFRFYKLFYDPSNIYRVLTSVQTTVVIANIVILYFAVEWHFVLSITFIALTNQFTFYRIMRDYLITKRMYVAERNASEKPGCASKTH